MSALESQHARAASEQKLALVTKDNQLQAARLQQEQLQRNVGIGDLSKVIRQIARITSADPGKPPSAYSIAKLLLILSGDADEPDTQRPARKLIELLTNNHGLGTVDQAASSSVEFNVEDGPDGRPLTPVVFGVIRWEQRIFGAA